MKKKLIITVSSIAIAGVLGFGIYHSNAQQASPELSKADIEALVSSQYPGTITEIELEKGFNKVVYEVEIKGNGKEYELIIDGKTGEILKLDEKEIKVASESPDVSKKKEETKNDDKASEEQTENKSTKDKSTDKVAQSDDDNNDKQNSLEEQDKQKETPKVSIKVTHKDNKSQGNKKSNQAKNVVIDYEAAKKIALAEFPGTIKEIDLDEDDGRLIYEVEVRSANGEAEIDIDAYTGEILSISIDRDDWDDDDDDNDDDDDDDDNEDNDD